MSSAKHGKTNVEKFHIYAKSKKGSNSEVKNKMLVFRNGKVGVNKAFITEHRINSEGLTC